MTTWWNIHNRVSSGLLKCLIAPVLLIFVPGILFGQNEFRSCVTGSMSDTVLYDTVYVPKGTLVILPHFSLQVPRDTFMLVKKYSLCDREIRMKASSKSLYDSAYHKFGRHKFSRALYQFAFIPPKIVTLPDNVQKIRMADPYKKYEGKIIRHIACKILDPFGPTILDTNAQPLSWLGRTGNNTHINTRKFVIRKTLLFKQGQIVDPLLLADNERILRSLSTIDDVSILVSPTDPPGDSVDIMVITKDVYSIGFDVIMLTPGKSVIRLYDGNLLGFGDRLANEFSIKNHRAPFIREEGVSYSLTNIGGSFIDGMVNYFHDDSGNQNVGLLLQRSFYSYKTRWAGSGLFQYLRDVNPVNDTLKITSYFHLANLWIGHAFFLKSRTEPVRLIVSEAAYNRHYYSRPCITPDSNKYYYNYFQLLTGISLSLNKYYLTDYVLEFGKRETLPYGYLFQITLGPEFTDYYTRYYGGIEIACGNFIKNFGYLSGRINYGGCLHGNSYEDAILKVQLQYMSYVYYTPDKRYKFRTFVMTDYRNGFNFKLNNRDFFNINQELLIQRTTDQLSLQGTGSLAFNLSTLIYTPWYFYGFRFALLGQLQGGFVTKKNIALFANPFYSGIRAGLVFKNDNLIFPALVISVFFYPTTPSGGPWLQYLFETTTGLDLPDFNVSALKEESLQN